MRRKLAIASTLVALAAAAAWLAGCESTDLTADKEGEIRVTAEPSTVVINRETETSDTSRIVAQVFDAGGYAMQGAWVTFARSGGTLASDGTPKQTDANGVATDVLTLQLAGDPTKVEVTVSSGPLSETVTVTKTVTDGNTPPSALLSLDPPDGQVRGRQVTFNGLGSSDPDGSITCYQWTIDSTVDAQDEVVQGAASSVFTRTYAVEQLLAVTLRVSDDPDAATTFCADGAATAPPSEFSPDADAFNGYEIACALDPPTVNAGTDLTVTAGGGTVDVTLNGTATATDAPIATFTWDCGNGSPLKTGQTVVCAYTNGSTTNVTYTAELRVADTCGLIGTDRVNVVVRP